MATICISGNVLLKTGPDISGTALLGNWDELIEQAEGTVCAATRHDWVKSWATISGTSTAPIVEGVVSDLAAIYGIQHTMKDFADRIEAEDKINVLRDSALRGISILRDKKTQSFMGVQNATT